MVVEVTSEVAGIYIYILYIEIQLNDFNSLVVIFYVESMEDISS